MDGTSGNRYVGLFVEGIFHSGVCFDATGQFAWHVQQDHDGIVRIPPEEATGILARLCAEQYNVLKLVKVARLVDRSGHKNTARDTITDWVVQMLENRPFS